jgi:SAM-dependent methyltransferase
MPDSRPPKICDYEGSSYRTDFWENRGREYEDRVERLALRRLLPAGGVRLLEIGAGFGRLTGEYDGYQQVVLLDYSFSQLQYARQHFGVDGRYVYVAADAYRLPFHPGVFDGATMIRVIHHMADVPGVLQAVRRVLTPGATFILEHANKRNFKAMLRYALRRQDWTPYSREPVEFVELNFDFHPEYIAEELRSGGFMIEGRVPLSFFRLGLLKNTVPVTILAGLDNVLQRSGLLFTPSIFVRSAAIGETEKNLDLSGDALFACPQSGGALTRDGDQLVCQECGLRYAVHDGIYDFKTPLE